MAELLPQERLQPSLLDRLVDDDPSSAVESNDRRVLSKSQLRQAVLRDLEWLLNAAQIRQSLLQGQAEVENSVLNYGLPPFSGETASEVAQQDVEASIRQVIERFEPRIDPSSLEVRVSTAGSILDAHNLLQLRIRGTLWAQPTPIELIIKSTIDLETGLIALDDSAGRSARG
ncbi:MAG TPA: type VI secretion system baseplate subunit TssE [Burkholderiaceae bacterium]|nr:type VI secretion system baseplate subunit TssE [Burkholderiaceae bacterium]